MTLYHSRGGNGREIIQMTKVLESNVARLFFRWIYWTGKKEREIDTVLMKL